MIFNEVIFVLSIVQLSLWRNRLARSAVNRKVGGSSPPRDERFHFNVNWFIYVYPVILNVQTYKFSFFGKKSLRPIRDSNP